MASSSEHSSNAQNSNVNPTSEEESASLLTVPEPQEANEYPGTYYHRIRSLLRTRWQHSTKNKILNATAFYLTGINDQRFKQLPFKLEEQIRKEIKPCLYEETPTFSSENTPRGLEAKRRRSEEPQNRCCRCGYHKSVCHRRIKLEEPEKYMEISEDSQPSTSSRVSCLKCNKEGHMAPNCPLLRERNHNPNELRVDCCMVEAPTGTLNHQGDSFPFYFDSGAECSLIKESVAPKFSGERLSNLVVMRGIGNTCINCTSQILSVIHIDGFTLKIIFHVLSDNHLKHDIMIGREILNQGFEISITQNSISIRKAKEIDDCDKTAEKEINFNEVDTDILDNDKIQLISILKNFKDSFVTDFPRTRVNTGELEIRLIESNVTVQRSPNRFSEEERKVVRARINELLEAKIIKPSVSTFARSILLVKRKDGSDRLYIDFRGLNKNTVADGYSLPLIEDQIAKLKKAKYFISLDMGSGFYQIPIHPNSTQYTAFVTPDGQYEYVTMPFGLKNAPYVFQKAIFKALGDLTESYIVVCLDNILIIAESINQGLERLQIVLDTLKNAGFSFYFDKCSFMKTSVRYLGYIIHNGEVLPNPDKIKPLNSLPAPTTVMQVRQFIGLASYFRKFVPKYSEITKPLYKLTLNNKNMNWTEKHEQIRQKIISILTNAPVIIMFDPNYPIELHTDASSDGYGAILMHKVEDKNRVVEYYSRRTSPTEATYQSYELETLAIVKAVKHFRRYLYGREFLVVTDCNSLKDSSNKIKLNDRVYKWWVYLQTFNFDIIYREGKKMAHADFFSRNPIE
jgi:hypothetical protein